MEYESQRSYIILQGRRGRGTRYALGKQQPLQLACWWNNIGRSLTNVGPALKAWGMRAGKTVPGRVLEWMDLSLPEERGAEPGFGWAEERLSWRLCGHPAKSRSWRNVRPKCSLFYGIFLWDGNTSNSVGQITEFSGFEMTEFQIFLPFPHIRKPETIQPTVVLSLVSVVASN